MIDLNKYSQFYFLGIGGIGMSALARFMAGQGWLVSGYDRSSSKITQELQYESINVNFTDSADAIPENVKGNNRETLIIYTPAIPADNKQLQFFRNHNFAIYKRAEVLGTITNTQENIAIGGTHGKTSTSWMMAHIMKQGGFNVFALLGGVSADYQTNYLAGKGLHESKFIIEADEYDRSFLQLSPDVEIITSAEADHLDIYGDHHHMLQAYQSFVDRVKAEGLILAYEGTEFNKPDHARRMYTYGYHPDSDFRAQNIRLSNGFYSFDFVSDDFVIKNIRLGVAGRHNILNSLPCIAVATINYQINEDMIRESLFSFSGVKRRMEFMIRNGKHIFIDDYAHHPTEIKATIDTIKELYPLKKITAVFQPHLYSRTRDFADEFASVLSVVDHLVLLDIYPAREMPIKGITSKIIFDKVSTKRKYLLNAKELMTFLETDDNEIILTLGAGDIDMLIEPIKEVLAAKK